MLTAIKKVQEHTHPHKEFSNKLKIMPSSLLIYRNAGKTAAIINEAKRAFRLMKQVTFLRIRYCCLIFTRS